jgi:peroxiredoxin
MKHFSVILLVMMFLMGTSAWAQRNAPEFTLSTPDGAQVSLSAQKGKYVVVEFMQTGCPACQRAGKVLQKLYEEYDGRLMVIGVTLEGPAAIRNYTQQHGVTFPVVTGNHVLLVNYLGLTPQRPNYYVPVFFFIGPDGKIIEERNSIRPQDREWFAGMEENLETSIRALVPAKPAAKPRKPAAKPASQK